MTRPHHLDADAVTRKGDWDRRRWFMLVALLLGQFMAALDVTVVNVAIASIGSSLHSSGSALQLVVAGYTASYGVLLITCARWGALSGYKRTFLIGVGGFTLASLACGFAPGTGILVTARFLQGAFAAAMVPQIISAIQAHFTGAARAKAVSAYSVAVAGGFSSGQLLGGLLVSANLFGSEWRPIFLVNVPIGLVVLLLVVRLMPSDEPTRGRRLDLVGLVVLVPAMALILLPVILGREGIGATRSTIGIAVGCALLVLFFWIESVKGRRGQDPLLNLRVFRVPGFSAGAATIAVAMTAYGAFLFSLALHLQSGLGDSALHAGLIFAPAALSFAGCGYYWRALPKAVHPVVSTIGLVAAALACLGLAVDLRSDTYGGPWLILAILVLCGGMGLGYSSLVAQSLTSVPADEAPDASGILTTIVQLGQVAGVATVGNYFVGQVSAVDGGNGSHHQVWTDAITRTNYLLAVVLIVGSLISLSLARTVRRSAAAD